MNRKAIASLAQQAAQHVKTEEDLKDFSRLLKKMTVEAALNAELDDHLGDDKYALSDNTNSRNGCSRKTLISEEGDVEIEVPRDRDGHFDSLSDFQFSTHNA